MVKLELPSTTRGECPKMRLPQLIYRGGRSRESLPGYRTRVISRKKRGKVCRCPVVRGTYEYPSVLTAALTGPSCKIASDRTSSASMFAYLYMKFIFFFFIAYVSNSIGIRPLMPVAAFGSLNSSKNQVIRSSGWAPAESAGGWVGSRENGIRSKQS